MKIAVQNYLSAKFYLTREQLMLERAKGRGKYRRDVKELQKEVRQLVVLQSQVKKASQRKLENIVHSLLEG